MIDTDLRIIRWFAGLVHRIPTLRWLSIPESAEIFAEAVEGQLDLVREARNLERFRENFRANPRCHFPEPIAPWVHPTVLVESFEEGDPIARYLTEKHEANPAIARTGLEVLAKMIFEDGLIHADLHPGNILIRLVDGEPHIVFLDVGMVAELDERNQSNYVEFFAAVAMRDGRKGAELMIRYAPHHDCRDPERFMDEVGRIFAEVTDRPVAEIEVSLVIGKVMDAVRRHRIQLESAFTTVNVSIMVLEGVGRQLDPSLDLIHETSPHLFAAIFRSRNAAGRADAAA